MSAPPVGDIDAARIHSTVYDIAVAVLERDVATSADLFDQGTPSIAFVRIVAEIGARFGIEVDIAALEEASINQLSQLVSHQLTAARPTSEES